MAKATVVAADGHNVDGIRARASLGAIDVTTQSNKNLSRHQKELLVLHFKLGHVGFKHLRWWLWSGKVIVPNAKAIANCTVKCAACKHGTAC